MQHHCLNSALRFLERHLPEHDDNIHLIINEQLWVNAVDLAHGVVILVRGALPFVPSFFNALSSSVIGKGFAHCISSIAIMLLKLLTQLIALLFKLLAFRLLLEAIRSKRVSLVCLMIGAV